MHTRTHKPTHAHWQTAHSSLECIHWWVQIVCLRGCERQHNSLSLREFSSNPLLNPLPNLKKPLPIISSLWLRCPLSQPACRPLGLGGMHVLGWRSGFWDGSSVSHGNNPQCIQRTPTQGLVYREAYPQTKKNNLDRWRTTSPPPITGCFQLVVNLLWLRAGSRCQ